MHFLFLAIILFTIFPYVLLCSFTTASMDSVTISINEEQHIYVLWSVWHSHLVLSHPRHALGSRLPQWSNSLGWPAKGGNHKNNNKVLGC